MEFFVVVLIFISCMIVLALLIYYCQEKRNPEYSTNEKQRDIASIAFSIGAPELINMQNGKSQTPAPIDFHRFYKQNMERQLRARNNYNNNSIDDQSDSDTSNSEKIYFGPNTPAYTVARRMSALNTRKSSSSAVVCHLPAENKILNGSSDCKIIINKEIVDDVPLDETRIMLKKTAISQHIIKKDVVLVENQEANEKRKEDESSVIEITPDSKKEDVSLDEKLLKVPGYNQSYKIKRKNNSSSSLNIVEEEKE